MNDHSLRAFSRVYSPPSRGVAPWGLPLGYGSHGTQSRGHVPHALPRPMAPPLGGEYSLGEARRGWPPMAPPTPKGFLLVGFTSKFTNIPGSIACNLLTLFLYSSM